ncbi:hypothetical protein [Kribbella sp. DT2]|uniref:hypothetical protein n=1 Tax=Kribbella sp. DT2 TaxID=3393427 RepID=UPI003CF11C5C
MATLAAVVPDLAQDWQVDLAGRRVNIGLAPEQEFVRDVLVLAEERETRIRQLTVAIADAALVLSSMEYDSIVIAHQLGKPCVLLNTLGWWGQIPPHPAVGLADLVLYQSFGDLPVPSAANAARVQPVVRPIEPRAAHEGNEPPLLHLGGLWLSGREDHTPETLYAQLLVPCLMELFDRHGHARPRVLTSPPISALLEPAAIRAETLPNDRYRETLRSAPLFVTTAGIGSLSDAWLTGLPTCVLPPANATQLAQLNELARFGLPSELTWTPPLTTDAFDESLVAALRTATGRADLLRPVEQQLADVEQRDRLSGAITALFSSTPRDLPRAVDLIEQLWSSCH